MFDTLLKEVSENGKSIIFLNNTPYNPFNEAAGIKKIGKIIERSTGIKFSEHLFPGLDAHEPSEKSGRVSYNGSRNREGCKDICNK